MAFANGRIPASALSPILGGRLRKDAALRWNAMNASLRKRGLPSVVPNGSYSSYRDLAGQILMRRQWCARGNCGNAAVPGTSNHGLGIAVDANRPDLVNAHGAPFGFQKRWSDASWEPWHMKWAGFGSTAGGASTSTSDKYPTIRKGSKNRAAITRLQKYLRGLNLTKVVNGSYGIWTRRAVRRFQEKHGLPVDGVVGPKTWAAIRRAAG